MEPRTLLVTGASGHLGRRVVECLLEAGTDPLIATTRNPEKLADFAARGVEIRKADFDDDQSLVTAFSGADRLLLISTDRVDDEAHRLTQHRIAVDAAKRAGVKHLVYTSIMKPESPTPVLVAPTHEATEQLIRASAMSWTILRETLYTEFLLGLVPGAAASGELVAAAGEGTAAFATREDVARACAAALASSEDASRTYDLTGPADVGFREVAKLASKLTGREIFYEPVAPAALEAEMVRGGLPPKIAKLVVSFHMGMAEGKLGPATDHFRKLTGREPTSVAEFLSANLDQLLASPR